MADHPVRELRLTLTADNYQAMLRFWRDTLGLPAIKAWDEPAGSGAILTAGRASVEILSPQQAALVDRVEVGSPTRDPVRVGLQVASVDDTAQRLASAEAQRLGGPVVTPWGDRSVRLRAPDGLRLSVFTVLDIADIPA